MPMWSSIWLGNNFCRSEIPCNKSYWSIGKSHEKCKTIFAHRVRVENVLYCADSITLCVDQVIIACLGPSQTWLKKSSIMREDLCNLLRAQSPSSSATWKCVPCLFNQCQLLNVPSFTRPLSLKMHLIQHVLVNSVMYYIGISLCSF